MAPFTSDGDLALNPDVLDDEPLLAEALLKAGFSLAVKPGTWARDAVHIDLLVPAAVSGTGRRSARLGLHDIFVLPALDPTDERTLEVAIAGLSALLVAKLHKLAEREHTPARWSPKDGLDVLRILQGGDLTQLGTTLAVLETHPVAGAVTREAHTFLVRLFGEPTAHGVVMAVRATVGVEESTTIAVMCSVLANQLLVAWESALSLSNKR